MKAQRVCLLSGVLTFVACGGMTPKTMISATISPPIEANCEKVPLKGCAELVDGVISYVAGDKQEAQKKLGHAIGKNSPEEIKDFARSLKMVLSLPGAQELAAPISEVTTIIVSMADEANVAATLVASAQKPSPPTSHLSNGGSSPDRAPSPEARRDVSVTSKSDRSELLLYSLNAASDPLRMVTSSTNPASASGGNPCLIGDAPATCVRLQDGPLVVTDVVALPGCPDSLFLLSAADPGNPDWLVEAQAVAVTGARLLVRGNAGLYVATRPRNRDSSKDVRCTVTWSGFTPRLVPQLVLSDSN